VKNTPYRCRYLLRQWALTLAVAGTVPLAFAQSNAIPENTLWLTESGNLEVKLAACGDALCGTVVNVLANKSMGAPGSEMQPVDTRPALGMVILSDLRASGGVEWKGEIYNRENGKHYSAIVTHPTTDQLVIRAYVGLPVFGKTQVWRLVNPTKASQ
jgi:uncharacterized protein (DUF2147 family)